ncbi:natural killer cell receptor 2B4-like [Paramisgurnus dabryanus]|uniref:natural killer cell receptor 2B4-like n=1 Tax=Paramisgurnus dabryanus TaxID=90735 RepID=UPI0031F378F2
MLSNKTLYRITSLCLLLVVNGVFGVDGDEVKSVSVMEGDSVTLHTDITDIQTDDQILWMFGPRETRIAEIYKKIINMFDNNETFGDRLKLDSQTGSLNITNINITNSGLYKRQILSNSGTTYKRFKVTVYAHLPVPVIIRDSSQCSSSSSSSSSSKCLLLCSVMNKRDVSLSWYKGFSLLSNISVSDLNIRLSLPLEIEYHDNNTYRCVVNNPITNQTQHLNITHLCQTCSDPSQVHTYLAGTITAVLLTVLALSVMYIFFKKHKRDKLKGNRFVPAEHEVETTEEEVHYADTTFCQQNQQKKRHCESETVYASVVT